MEIKDTVILLGDSPFIKTVEGQLPYVLDRYTSVGINRIVNTYKTSYQIFVDERMIPNANAHLDIPVISLRRYGDMIKVPEKELYDSYAFTTFKGDNIEKKDLLKDEKLAWCGFTHDFALSYLITKGWKNIVLLGAADMNMGSGHYSVNMAFTPSHKLIQRSKKFIEEVCAERADIFTCNPDSILNVPKISIEELLV